MLAWFRSEWVQIASVVLAKVSVILSTTRMASFSMRKVATSPRNLAGPFLSPKVSSTPHVNPRHQTLTKAGTPNSASSQHSPWSSLNLRATYLSPYTARSRLNVSTQGPLKRSKSVRKLTWSERGEHSLAEVHPLENSKLACTLVNSHACSNGLVSVDTPNRAEMLENFRKKKRIFNVLGKGSFGTVIEASYKGKPVAVKILFPSQAMQQLCNEANCVGFSHPNIVSLMKVLPPGNDVAGVVIMEKVVGYSLQMLLDHDLFRNEMEQRVRYSMHICSALAYCHKHEVLHLDVKPQNVLVDLLTDTCKLCDFGCSYKIGTETISQLPRGTAGYAAPEILQGSKPSSAADVYSLGITMWQLLSGETPFKDMRAHTVIYKVVASEYRPYIPGGLCPEDEIFLSLIKKCWSQSPFCRPSIPQILEELKCLQESSCK